LLVAGGSGICPLMAMLRLRQAAGSAVPTRLLYSSRSLEDVIYRDELDRLVATGSGLAVIHTLTRSVPEGWQGLHRRIDTAMLSTVAWPPGERPLIFVCGPTPLVESAAESLVNLGHEPAHIKTERFGPTGG
ncbi:MAG TPA: oxidoreductase, partial [Candidatus Dormibacteraeota bacterium]